jgi:nucleotide-binding universal stress UspA family protein
MLTVRSILCPVDFSEPSRRALVWASTIARQRGGELNVLFVGEPLLTQAASIRLGVDLALTEIRPALRAFVEATLPADDWRRASVQMMVTVGDPAEVILRTARRRKTGLIVMGTHGRGGLRKFVLGSTTEDVLRRTRCPVLAVPAPADGRGVDRYGNLAVKGILLATDFRDSAMAAVQWAADLAFDLNARLVVAHVVEPVAVPRRWRTLAADVEYDRVASARERLVRLAANLREAHVSSALSVGAAAESIAAMAIEHAAGLVVMGRAAAADPDPHPGAIAYRVLRLAHVPILVAPARAGRSHADRPSPCHAGTHDECPTAHPERARAAILRRAGAWRELDGALGAPAR